MKKIWGILIVGLGLLVSITTYASEATLKRALEELIPVGSSKKHLCKVTGGLKMHKKRNTFIRKSQVYCLNWYLNNDPKGDYIYFPEYKNSFIYYPKYKTEIVHHSHATYETDDAKLVHFVYENVNKPMKCTWMVCTKGDGALKKIAYSREEALAIADPEYAKVSFPESENSLKQLFELLTNLKKNDIKLSEMLDFIEPKKSNIFCTALNIVRSTEFLNCALVGMENIKYTRENVKVLQDPKLDPQIVNDYWKKSWKN